VPQPVIQAVARVVQIEELPDKQERIVRINGVLVIRFTHHIQVDFVHLQF
jgi:hypothetical protein